MKPWIILAFATLAIACAPPTPVVVEEPMIEPFVEPTSTPDCLHAEGVTMEVRRIRDTTVALDVSGLQPGEIPSVTFSASSSSGAGMRIESGRFVKGADGQGNFSYEEVGFIPPQGETSATWDIRFIHARGVECATVTLP